MRYGISGAPIPVNLPFAVEITQACSTVGFWPCLAYGIKKNESGETDDASIMQDGAVGDLLPNGENAGHGVFMLTSSWPSDWADPYANALYALTHPGFLNDAATFWIGKGLTGDSLAKAIAASFNAGIEQAYEWHLRYDDVDKYTTDNYGARAVSNMKELVLGTV